MTEHPKTEDDDKTSSALDGNSVILHPSVSKCSYPTQLPSEKNRQVFEIARQYADPSASMNSHNADDRLNRTDACQPSDHHEFDNKNPLPVDSVAVSVGSIEDARSKDSLPVIDDHDKKVASDLKIEDKGAPAEDEIVQSSTDVEVGLSSSGTSDCGSVIMEMADLLSHSSSNASATTPTVDLDNRPSCIDGSTGTSVDPQENVETKLEDASLSSVRYTEPASTTSSDSERTTISETSCEEEGTKIDGKDTVQNEHLERPHSAMDAVVLDQKNEEHSYACCESIHTSDLSPFCSTRESTSDTEDRDARLLDDFTCPPLVDQSLLLLDRQPSSDSKRSSDRTITKGIEDPLSSGSSERDLIKISDESTKDDSSSSASSVASESEIEIRSECIADIEFAATEKPTSVEIENPMPCDSSTDNLSTDLATLPHHRPVEGASDRHAELSPSTFLLIRAR